MGAILAKNSPRGLTTMTEMTRKERAAAKMAWMITKLSDPENGERDLFGFLGSEIGVSPGDTRSLALALEFAEVFGEGEASRKPRNAAAAMRRVMGALERHNITHRSTRALNAAHGWQRSWSLTPAALFRLENGVSPEELATSGVPSGAFAENGAMFSPKTGPVPAEKIAPSEGSEMNLYVIVVVEDGDEVRKNWRGGKDCEEALALAREDGLDPIFVESLKGGAPGYWCRDEAERGISQMGMAV